MSERVGSQTLAERALSRRRAIAVQCALQADHMAYDDTNDEPSSALLDLWRQGDLRAGGRFYDRHHARVVRYFQRLLFDTSEVMALVNDTFMAARNGRRDFEGPEKALESYLLAIGHNKFREYLRRKKSGERLIDTNADADEVAEVTIDELGIADPSDYVEREEENKLLLKALRRIPIDYQLLFMLSYWEGLTNPEIARMLNLPVGTVASRLRLAKERLQKMINDLEGNPALLKTTTMRLSAWLARMSEELKKKKKGGGDGGDDGSGATSDSSD